MLTVLEVKLNSLIAATALWALITAQDSQLQVTVGNNMQDWDA